MYLARNTHAQQKLVTLHIRTALPPTCFGFFSKCVTKQPYQQKNGTQNLKFCIPFISTRKKSSDIPASGHSVPHLKWGLRLLGIFRGVDVHKT